ncbi:hypothetical protein Cni_G12298 [Canna indica]|uniref:Homologous recombination OB-fold protein OB-fold domain-containing protein n=1 Tax=Canna indica TaxID=4628 RepID=A0AAQ3KAE2_9LILI|nr:hypothetical protein Cni_G12298 [Canna indica]
MADKQVAEPPRWEDAIDVDDSDLLPLLTPSSSHPQNLSSQFPPLRPCSQFPPPPSQTLALAPSPAPPPLSLSQSLQEPPPCSTRLIPGPAGAVQAAMRRQFAVALQDGPCLGDRRENDSGLELDEEDGDFKLNPWLCALEFLGDDCSLLCPISSIKTRNTERVPQVVGIVKSCTTNGLGNLFLTLKDPTGSIEACVHQGVLSDCNLGADISAGCVLVLKQVVAFCPTRSARYLNVTSKNVMKLIKKDCGLPQKQIPPLYKGGGRNAESGYGKMEGEPSLWNVAKSPIDKSSEKYDHNATMANQNKGGGGGLFSDRCATICTKRVAELSDLELKEAEHQLAAGERATRLKTNAQEEVRKNLNCQWTMVGGDRYAGSGSCNTNTTIATTLMSSELGHSFASNMEFGDGEASEPLAMHRDYADNGERSLSGGRIDNSCKINIASGLQCDSLVKIATSVMPAKSDLVVNEAKKLISEVSVAQWTDEQLLELFSDYQDEIDFVNPGI